MKFILLKVDGRAMLRNCLVLHTIFRNYKPYLSLFNNKSPRGISRYAPIFSIVFPKISWIQFHTLERWSSVWISGSYITQWWSVTLFRQTWKYMATTVVWKVQGRAVCCSWEREIASELMSWLSCWVAFVVLSAAERARERDKMTAVSTT